MGRFLTIAALLLSQCAPLPAMAEQCTEAAATTTPCEGVVLPRDWALQAAACRRLLPELAGKITELEDRLEKDKVRLANAQRPWYSSTWVGFVVGIPVGVAIVWLVKEVR
jgi:hypothetical protein